MPDPKMILDPKLVAQLATRVNLGEQQLNAAPIKLANIPDMEARGAVKTILQQPTLKAMAIDAPHVAVAQNVMAAVAPGVATHEGPPNTAQLGGPNNPAAQTPVSATDGYARVEMHSENGVLSVVGVHEVPGALVLPTTVAHGLVYEATVDDQQVALGSLPDAGLSRSFANADVPGPEGKHRVFTRPSFNFFVRIPKAQLTTAALPKLNIVLHRVTDAPERLTALTPLARQPGIQAVEVSRLPGLALEKLTPEVRPQLERLVLKQP
jgi:hypothetical protein